jgi:hypothetical protein
MKYVTLHFHDDPLGQYNVILKLQDIAAVMESDDPDFKFLIRTDEGEEYSCDFMEITNVV